MISHCKFKCMPFHFFVSKVFSFSQFMVFTIINFKDYEFRFMFTIYHEIVKLKWRCIMEYTTNSTISFRIKIKLEFSSHTSSSFYYKYTSQFILTFAKHFILLNYSKWFCLVIWLIDPITRSHIY